MAEINRQQIDSIPPEAGLKSSNRVAPACPGIPLWAGRSGDNEPSPCPEIIDSLRSLQVGTEFIPPTAGLRLRTQGLGEETVIIQESQKGNNEAFSEIVKRYQHRLYNTIYQLVNSPEDALDICQEVFLKAFRNIRNFRGDSSFLTYLYRIAFNECFSYRNKRQRIKTSIESLRDKRRAESIPISIGTVQEKEHSEYIQTALNSLEPELKEVIILKDMEGFSYAEVAKSLNISVSTVRTNLEKARQVLRVKLKDLL